MAITTIGNVTINTNEELEKLQNEYYAFVNVAVKSGIVSRKDILSFDKFVEEYANKKG